MKKVVGLVKLQLPAGKATPAPPAPARPATRPPIPSAPIAKGTASGTRPTPVPLAPEDTATMRDSLATKTMSSTTSGVVDRTTGIHALIRKADFG